MTNYTDIINNEHFQSLAHNIRRATWSRQWQRQHGEVPFWTLMDNLDKVTPVGEALWNRTQVVTTFTDLLGSMKVADPTMDYTTEDIEWLIGVIDDPALAKVTIALWKAYATAPADLVTPAEAAEATNTSESYWRNRAAAGDIPGAYKKGKQWLLPRAAVESKQKTSDD